MDRTVSRARTPGRLIESAVNFVRGRLSNRPDSEHHQAIVRFAVVSAYFAYVVWLEIARGHVEHLFQWSLLIASLEFIVGGIILAGIVINPGKSPARRILGMVADYIALGAAMYFLGDVMAPLYAVYLWVTIGNGLRYGFNFLIAAMTLATVSFSCVILYTPYWLSNRPLAWGLLAGLIALPGYISNLIRALRHATEEARQANEAKSRFLAAMSHELRTPLNGIVGMSDLLSTARLPPEETEYSRVIQTSARTLLTLIENVLDISAIEAGKLKQKLNDFRVRDLLSEIHLMLQPHALEKKLDFDVSVDAEIPSQVKGDANHLRQVLINLTANAIKFTERGSVKISVSQTNRIEEQVTLRFSIRDTGVGIPASAQSRIFEAFEQADQGRGRRFDGTGLGTSIAKALTELAGGTISFESTEGEGSHFWVDMPFQEVTDTAFSENEAASNQNVISFDDPFIRHRARVPQMSILIADDQQANLTVLKRILEKSGHKVQQVSDAEEVLDRLEHSRYDAVVIDMHMPGLSGLDVLRHARFMQAGSEVTPFIVLSADATPEMKQACDQAGAKAFLTKPIATPLLLETLAEIALGGAESAPSKSAKPQSSTIAFEASQVLSRDVLDDISQQFGREFLDLFVEECMRDLTKNFAALEKVAMTSNWDDFRDVCHAIKGVAGNIGATGLAALASDAMKLGYGDLEREWRARLAGMTGQFKAVRRQLPRLAVDKASQNL
ncbi:MAG: ATP-binding protein [Rudaea sp.]|uniref:ATP-binding protein n=1 Tax=Rudaea sp. TaxID=2136325 RepID=UPI0039E4A63D